MTYIDPYMVLMADVHNPCTTDTTGLDVTGCFAQMDSLGITLSHTLVDSLSSNNAGEVKLMGQDREMWVHEGE